jgi:CheY-like chemotaxis protein
MKEDKDLIKDKLRKIFSSHKSSNLNHKSIKDMILIYENMAKEITSTKYAFIILPNKDDSFHIPTLDITIPIKSDIDGGILFECYDTKRLHHIPNARRSFLYRSYIDNFIDIKIQDILVIPIIKKSEDDVVIGILWIAIEKSSDNSFTQKNIDYLSVLSDSIKTKITLEEKKDIKKEEIEKLNILIIDDSSIILRFIEIILKQNYNIDTITALNATDGIKQFNTNSIDIIFMDERMEGLKGHEAIELIRKIELDNQTDPIPIFGLTSDTSSSVRDTLLNSGASLVLHKPIDALEIINAIKKFRIINKKST